MREKSSKFKDNLDRCLRGSQGAREIDNHSHNQDDDRECTYVSATLSPTARRARITPPRSAPRDAQLRLSTARSASSPSAANACGAFARCSTLRPSRAKLGRIAAASKPRRFRLSLLTGTDLPLH
jgi:hypothetical protein